MAGNLICDWTESSRWQVELNNNVTFLMNQCWVRQLIVKQSQSQRERWLIWLFSPYQVNFHYLTLFWCHTPVIRLFLSHSFTPWPPSCCFVSLHTITSLLPFPPSICASDSLFSVYFLKLRDHTGTFACFSSLTTNCLYFTLLLIIFESIQ